MTTTYYQGDIIDYDTVIRDWIKSDSKLLVFTFHFRATNFLREMKDIFEELASPDYPKHVSLAIKCLDDNPNNDQMVKWNQETIDKWGYWFIIGTKIEEVSF